MSKSTHSVTITFKFGLAARPLSVAILISWPTPLRSSTCKQENSDCQEFGEALPRLLEVRNGTDLKRISLQDAFGQVYRKEFADVVSAVSERHLR